MKIILLAIVIFCTSFNVVQKKLWICGTIVDLPNKKLHVPAVVAAKDLKEARKKYLHYVMYECKAASGGIIDTNDRCLVIGEITDEMIID